MIIFFKTIFYYPLLNLLVFLYDFLGSFGLSIIAVTVIVRLALFYFSKKSIIAQRKLADLQPEIKKIQEKHKDDKAEQSKALMEFYKNSKVNPFSGCLPLLIQLPVLISLYYVFFKGINSISISDLYSFVVMPDKIDFYFLGFFDLSKSSKIMAFLAGALQFVQSRHALKSQKQPVAGEFGTILNYQMVYFFPLLTFFIGITLPAGLSLYWAASTAFSLAQQVVIEKYYLKTN